MRKRRGRARRRAGDDRHQARVDWLDHEGRLVLGARLAAGATSDSLRLDKLRQALRHPEPPGGGARARRALEIVLLAAFGEVPAGAIGRVYPHAAGLSYEVYVAECCFDPTEPQRAEPLVVRVPRSDCEPGLAARSRTEWVVLEHLATQDFPLRAPRMLGGVLGSSGVIWVQTAVAGLPVEMRAGRSRGTDPWQVVAAAAAACHAVDFAPIASQLECHASRRDHALASLAGLDRLQLPEAIEARSWAESHLPPDSPPRLLHGDLLGQNLVVDVEAEQPLGVLDWERAAIGDPAFDLAIATRGVRRPFQVEGGLELLIDAYNEAAGSDVTPAQVQVHELCMLAGWVIGESARSGPASSAFENERDRLRSLLRRLRRG